MSGVQNGEEEGQALTSGREISQVVLKNAWRMVLRKKDVEVSGVRRMILRIHSERKGARREQWGEGQAGTCSKSRHLPRPRRWIRNNSWCVSRASVLSSM